MNTPKGTFSPAFVSDETKLINFLYAYIQTFVTIYGPKVPEHVFDTPYLDKKEMIAVPNLPSMSFHSSLSIMNGLLKVFGPYELTLMKMDYENEEPVVTGLILSKFVMTPNTFHGSGTATPLNSDATGQIYKPNIFPMLRYDTIQTFHFINFCNVH